MVYHVNDYVAQTSNLVSALESNLRELDVFQQMLMRVNALKADEPVPQEILDYIEDYTGCEGLMDDAKTVSKAIGAIIDKLKDALAVIWRILCEVFKLLFDSQYRHRKVFLDIQRGLLQLTSDTDAVKQFESIPCSVISQEDALKAINVTQFLTNLIELAAKETDMENITSLLTDFQDRARIGLEGGRVVDKYGDLTATHFGSFAEAGWTVDGLQKVIAKQIDCITRIENLKQTQSDLERDKRQLERKLNSLVATNVVNATVQDLQVAIAVKSRITRVISQTIEIMVTRYGAISTILKAINCEARRVMEERGLIRKSFQTWLKEQGE